MKHKRVERLWRKEGLRVPRKQPKRGRLWLAEGAIVRRRAERPNDVWPYDFVFERTAAGRALKHLVVVAAYTRACLAIVVARRLPSIEVLACLAELFVRRAVPAHIRSDNGPEFAAKAVPHWLERVGVQTLFIEPGSPWENGSVESLNGKLRDECLNRERLRHVARGADTQRAVALRVQPPPAPLLPPLPSACTIGSTSSSPVPAAAGGTSPILRSGTTPGGTSPGCGPRHRGPDSEPWRQRPNLVAQLSFGIPAQSLRTPGMLVVRVAASLSL